jgi:hypothetical protein
VIVAEGLVVCEHLRIIERSHRMPGRVIYDWRHYLALAVVLGPMADKGSLQRKPGALRNGAPFVEMPEAFRKLQSLMLRKPGGDREMVDILSLVLHHDEQDVLCAVEMALEAGVPTKTHVLNLLYRLVDGTQTEQPDVTPPTALSLGKEPEANVARYDGLRQGGTRHAS